MTDLLTYHKDADAAFRTVRPDTAHGGDVTRRKQSSKTSQSDDVQQPPSFQKIRRKGGKSGSPDGSGDPPEDPERPKRESDEPDDQRTMSRERSRMRKYLDNADDHLEWFIAHGGSVGSQDEDKGGGDRIRDTEKQGSTFLDQDA